MQDEIDVLKRATVAMKQSAHLMTICGVGTQNDSLVEWGKLLQEQSRYIDRLILQKQHHMEVEGVGNTDGRTESRANR